MESFRDLRDSYVFILYVMFILLLCVYLYIGEYIYIYIYIYITYKDKLTNNINN